MEAHGSWTFMAHRVSWTFMSHGGHCSSAHCTMCALMTSIMGNDARHPTLLLPLLTCNTRTIASAATPRTLSGKCCIQRSSYAGGLLMSACAIAWHNCCPAACRGLPGSSRSPAKLPGRLQQT